MARQKLKAKALLIDLDGTIVDSTDAFIEAAKMAFSAIGHPQSSNDVGLEIARHLQRTLPIADFFEKTNVGKAVREKFITVFLQSFYKMATNKTELLPNAAKTLFKLSDNFLLALITRRHVPKDLVKKELQRLHIDSYFRAIVTSLDVERPTPFPDAILKAAKILQVSIHDCVVVSDSGVDIQAGKSAGAKTVVVLSGLFEKEELRKEKPDLIIKDINDLSEHLVAV
jgi:phosphoglycolate phosphatase